MNAVLYAVTVVIWGSTWLAIKGQLGEVHPTLSVFYRFALAAVLMLAYARARGLPLKYPARMHVRFALMGGLMFSGNFVCFYFAEQHLATGLVSILFAMSLLLNIVFARLFFHRRVSPVVLVGGGIGLLGIGTVFWPALADFDPDSGNGLGTVLSIAGTLVFCLGNVVSGKVQAEGVPVVQSTGWSMAYGAVLVSPFATVLGHGTLYEPTWQYTGSLLYLALFGSVIGFGTYLTLLGRIGGERAAYATVLFPIVSLLLSTVFEDFTWSVRDGLGVVLVLLGNAVVLAGPKLLARRRERDPAPPDRKTAPANASGGK
ncbi:DMT family transporter [Streptomyces syringium]|uniref:Drug/metabolite transporter (DMT)-like permease n=1 Tax=Streptomyces syringium TaxID=76729 RepID=A0ABS4XXW4_9ACTN|nr:DMT family transporter [Streptomyces syringium]MBP2401357.1 drug/metabolite transporter (DMT)-like permease [Streptomyces syringium]